MNFYFYNTIIIGLIWTALIVADNKMAGILSVSDFYCQEFLNDNNGTKNLCNQIWSR